MIGIHIEQEETVKEKEEERKKKKLYVYSLIEQATKAFNNDF